MFSIRLLCDVDMCNADGLVTGINMLCFDAVRLTSLPVGGLKYVCEGPGDSLGGSLKSHEHCATVINWYCQFDLRMAGFASIQGLD